MFVVGFCLTLSLFQCLSVTEGTVTSGQDFTNEWAAYIPGGPDIAKRVAHQFGYTVEGKIGALDDHYRLTKDDHPRRSRRSAEHHTKRLVEDDRVLWAEQQVARIRTKRDLIDKREEAEAYRNVRFVDKYWPKQWYLNGEKGKRDMIFRRDLNVVPVWQMNITGNGVRITVMDDGLERNHSDIQQNYCAECSYDFNDNDDDPTPRYDPDNENTHGTRCAGEIAMVANNQRCGVGVAYNAKIGGIRMLDGHVTDSLEASSLGYGLEHIDIYSASWGPSDDGQTLEGPGKLATKAFEAGVRKGRNGKGAIYLWASGNGGMKDDNCDCDGYTNSIYTLSVSSASETGKAPWYSEKCASTLTTTYSSGGLSDSKIVTIDWRDGCMLSFTGTSAAAPLAAGVVGLLLESNPDLTWRDVQHLVVWTSTPEPLMNNPGWKQNGVGLLVNSRFGFGQIDAAALINAADPDLYHNVPEKQICVVETEDKGILPQQLNSGWEVSINFTTSGCKGQENEIGYLEHMQIYTNITYSRRGDLEIYVYSPSGLETMLLSKRSADRSSNGISDWAFMSVQNWGENPAGIWTVKLIDNSDNNNQGFINNVRLVMHGTKEEPDLMRRFGGRGAHEAVFAHYNSQDFEENSDEDFSEEGLPSVAPREQLAESLGELKNYITPMDSDNILSAPEQEPSPSGFYGQQLEEDIEPWVDSLPTDQIYPQEFADSNLVDETFGDFAPEDQFDETYLNNWLYQEPEDVQYSK